MLRYPNEDDFSPSALFQYPTADDLSPAATLRYPKEEDAFPNALFFTPTALDSAPVEIFWTPTALEYFPESKSTHLSPGLSKSYLLFKEPTATLPYPFARFSVPKAAE